MLGRHLRSSETGLELHRAALEFLLARAEIRERRGGASTIESDTREVWLKVGDLGWFKSVLSAERGGLGLEYEDVAHLFFALGETPTPGPFLDHLLAIPLVVNAYQGPHSDVLDMALNGQRVITFADSAAEVDTLRRGSSPVVNNQRLVGKVGLVRAAAWADSFLVVAANNKGECVCLVDSLRPGVTVSPCPSLDPVMDYGCVELDIGLSPEDVLIDGDDAARMLAVVRPAAAVAISCELCALGLRASEMSLDYARTRVQFDRPIANFQVIQHFLADLSVDSTSLRNLAIRTLRDLAEDPTDWVAAAALKSATAATTQSMVEQALQIHGGVGFTIEHPLHVFIQRVLALVGWYGDSHELNVTLGQHEVNTATPSPWTLHSTLEH